MWSKYQRKSISAQRGLLAQEVGNNHGVQEGRSTAGDHQEDVAMRYKGGKAACLNHVFVSQHQREINFKQGHFTWDYWRIITVQNKGGIVILPSPGDNTAR